MDSGLRDMDTTWSVVPDPWVGCASGTEKSLAARDEYKDEGSLRRMVLLVLL
jgi:hypothetical protein